MKFLVYVTVRNERWSDVLVAHDEADAVLQARRRTPHAITITATEIMKGQPT